MTAGSYSTNAVSIPEIVSVEATEIAPPPSWALMERELINLMEEAAPLMVKKYAEPGGALYYVDDLYERFYNWGLFYAIGADGKLLDLALQEWNATTRSRDDRFVNPARSRFRAQVHNEYYNLVQPDDWHPGNRLCSEWHHMSGGNMAFYDLGVACPTISENVRRARRFAAMFLLVRTPKPRTTTPRIRSSALPPAEQPGAVHGGKSCSCPAVVPRLAQGDGRKNSQTDGHAGNALSDCQKFGDELDGRSEADRRGRPSNSTRLS